MKPLACDVYDGLAAVGGEHTDLRRLGHASDRVAHEFDGKVPEYHRVLLGVMSRLAFEGP